MMMLKVPKTNLQLFQVDLFNISVYFSYILIEQFGKQIEAFDESQQTHHEDNSDFDSDLGDDPFKSTWLELANIVKRSAKIVNGSLIAL